MVHSLPAGEGGMRGLRAWAHGVCQLVSLEMNSVKDLHFSYTSKY